MIIKSIHGKKIVQTRDKTIRTALEYCAQKGTDLAEADLRQIRCRGASLDGLKAPGACFWGADFTGSDLGFADLHHADLRCANLKDVCLGDSDLSHADLQGTYFSGTIIEGAFLNGAVVSCPSFWECDLQAAAGIKGLTYNHLGESPIILDGPPLVIRGLPKRLVLTDKMLIWGNELYSPELVSAEAQKSLFTVKTMIERAMAPGLSRFAKNLSRR